MFNVWIGSVIVAAAVVIAALVSWMGDEVRSFRKGLRQKQPIWRSRVLFSIAPLLFCLVGFLLHQGALSFLLAVVFMPFCYIGLSIGVFSQDMLMHFSIVDFIAPALFGYLYYFILFGVLQNPWGKGKLRIGRTLLIHFLQVVLNVFGALVVYATALSSI